MRSGPATQNQPSDGELLACVVARADNAEHAFEELIRRHASMVLNVCQRLLGDPHEADDAAQATFLVLWRKAKSLRRRSSVAGWLHHVARNVCRNARRSREVRTMHEQKSAKTESPQSLSQDRWDEIRDVLDEEIERLPSKYQLPVVLFHLEGRSIQEVATVLGANESTVTTWLNRAREILARGVTRRGIVVTSSAIATTIAANAHAATASPTFVSTVLKTTQLIAAGKLVSGATLSTTVLAEGVIRMMIISKLKLAATIGMAATLSAGMFVGWLAYAPRVAADDEGAKTQVADGETQSASADDAALIQGTWRAVEIQQVGRDLSQEEKVGLEQGTLKIQFTAETWTVLADESSARYRLNPKTKPPQIEYIGDDGKIIARGIYELKGDKLRLCQGRKSDGSEPLDLKDFDIKKAPPKEFRRLMVMVREKDQDAADDARLIQGTWRALEIHQVGREPSKEEKEALKNGIFTIHIIANRWITLADNSEAKYRLNTATKPPQIEFITPQGELIARAIYELKGDKLKVCQGRTSARGEPKVPTSFDINKAPRGDDPTLLVMEREKARAEKAK